MTKFNKDGVENRFLPVDYQDHEDSIRSKNGESQKTDGTAEECQEEEETPGA